MDKYVDCKLGVSAKEMGATGCTRCGKCCYFYKWFTENQRIVVKCIHLSGEGNNHKCAIYGTGTRHPVCRNWKCWDPFPPFDVKRPEGDMKDFVDDPGV